MNVQMKDIRRAGSRFTEVHGPFRAEGRDIRNAFGVIVGTAIDERHAELFSAAFSAAHIGQVKLRLAAHQAKNEILREDFAKSADAIDAYLQGA